MVLDVILKYLELIIICLIGFLGGVLLIVFVVFFVCILRKKVSGEEEKEDEVDATSETKPLLKSKKLKTSASNLSTAQTAFHSKNVAFVLKNNEDSKVNFTASYRPETEKLILDIKEITIGGRTRSVQDHISELDKVFFRILLNNNTTNSIILSESYGFSSKIIIEENFLFSLKESQMRGTSVVVEVFVSLANNPSDLLLGWLEVDLPFEAKEYPFGDYSVLQEMHRPIDLYLAAVGYVCVCLTSLPDRIKTIIFASNFRAQEWEKEERKDSIVFFNLQIKSVEDSSFGHACKTTLKSPVTTIGWNEVFNFDVPNNLKRNCFIVIELFKGYGRIGSPLESVELKGTLTLGLTEQCPEKSQTHWTNILENDNIEFTKWHPIRSNL